MILTGLEETEKQYLIAQFHAADHPGPVDVLVMSPQKLSLQFSYCIVNTKMLISAEFISKAQTEVLGKFVFNGQSINLKHV